MPIYKLIPVDKISNHWQASWHRDYVIVRAPSEDEARKKAALELGIAPQPEPGSNTLWSPWQQANIVSCQRLEKSNYDLNLAPI